MNYSHRTVCLILFYFVALLRPFGQAQQSLRYFTRITDQNGLSHNYVNCIAQDKRGFLWIGTKDGLNRYDGHNFKVFRNEPGNPASISGNIISDLLVDAEGVLWIATLDGGLTRYDYRLSAKEQFKQYKHLPGNTGSIPVNIVNDLFEDAQGYLWLATSGNAVIRFNKKTGVFDDDIVKGRLTALVINAEASGKLWVGRQGGGLLKLDPRTLSTETDNRYANLYSKLPHAVITSLYRDAENNMWYGSWDKVLYCYDFPTQQEKIFAQNAQPGSFVNDDIRCFAEDGEGRLWMGGQNEGLQIFDKRTGKFTQYAYSPSLLGTIGDNQVNCIFMAPGGSVWLGTARGISVLHRQQEQFRQQFLPGYAGKKLTIYDFRAEPGGALFVGTSNGLYYRKNAQEPLQHFPLSYKGVPLAVTRFYKSNNGTLYLGTNYSLFRYEPATGKLELLPNTDKDLVMNKIIESRVVSIAEDSIEGRPVLIVSPYGHFLAYYDWQEKHWVSRLDSGKQIINRFNLRDNLLRKIFKARNGRIWMAQAKEGLGEWLRQPVPKLENYKNDPNKPNTLSNNNVFDIAEDEKGNLWISTIGGGLNYFDVAQKSFTHIAVSHNLVEGIQTDARQQVWMVSAGNLHRYNPQTQTYSSFLLPDMEKSGGITGDLYKAPDGKMYAAGKNYFIEFDPAQVTGTPAQPAVHFTGLEIFNQSYSNLLQEKKITLRYNQNYFTVEFSAPDFSPGMPVQYAYKLEGFNTDWVETGTRNFVSFSNLSGGEYTLRVRATNTPGVWSEREAAIRIKVIPPFWKTWWFYLVCAVVVAGSAYLLYRYRVNELIKRQAMRNKIASDLHDNIGSTLSSISVYSQVAEIQHKKQNPAALADILQKIGHTSTEMISEMNDIVWAIKPGNDSLEKMIARMESYAKPLLAASNIAFAFRYNDELLRTSLGMEKRKNVYLVFKEAVNNALKYAACTRLDVAIAQTRSQLQMTITDNGKGFDPDRLGEKHNLGGNGLKNMEMRAAEMKGRLEISSKPGAGTTITLHCPIP